MTELTPNGLLGLSYLFKLAENNPQEIPGNVFVLLPVDCLAPLSQLLLAASVGSHETSESTACPIPTT